MLRLISSIVLFCCAVSASASAFAGDGEALFLKGNEALGKGDIDTAIASFKKAIKHKPNNPLYHSNLGVSLRMKGDINGSIVEHKKAIAIEPNIPHLHYNLAYSYLQGGYHDFAKDELLKVLEIDPDFQDAKDALEKLKKLGY